MSLLSLKDIRMYKVLLNRTTPNSITYAGILQPIAEDTNYLLEYIKILFPEYPGHDIQHSYRILNYLSSVVSQEIKDTLSDTELFCLIMAALFHDTGMALYNDLSSEEIRKKHHAYAQKIIDKYFEKKLDILQYKNRIKDAIVFACKSHGEPLEKVYDRSIYEKKDMIDGDFVRYSVLASLLRIGDLLDLDTNRVNRFILSTFSKNFSDVSIAHNNRHLCVEKYYHDPKELSIEVLANNVQEFQIWTVWFDYIKNEILYINSYLKKYGIGFPCPQTTIHKLPDADYEVEELRFEIDDTGAIWKILSQSIYTDEYDFIRELVQNAIDATLLDTYLNPTVQLQHQSPRSWEINNNTIFIGLSSRHRELLVIDRGVGMSFSELKNFLFKIAGSGYSQLEERKFAFPSIAKYGIGFVSCLINADNIQIFTSKKQEKALHYVELTANNNLAIMQNLTNENYTGTTIRLKLKHNFSYTKLSSYLTSTFCYPSVGILCLDIDRLKELSSHIPGLVEFNDIGNNPYKLPDYFDLVEVKRAELLLPLERRAKCLSAIDKDIDDLLDWIKYNKDFDENYSDKDKFQDFHTLIKNLNTLINASEYSTHSFPLNVKNISEKDLFINTQLYVDRITAYQRQLATDLNDNKQKMRLYNQTFCTIEPKKVSFKFDWKYCVIDLDKNLNISNISFSNEPMDLSERIGIILLNHEACDNDNGYEYSALNGFLFSKGEVCASISRVTGHHVTRIAHTVYEKQYIIGSDNIKDLCYQELCEEVEEEYWDEGEDLDTVVTIDHLISALVCNNNNIYYYDNIDPSGIEISARNASQDFDRWLQDEISVFLNSIRISNGADISRMEELSDLQSFSSLDSYKLCQDGIKFPNSLHALFPAGIFKIHCNLTASSRLPLNVTRHKTSEMRDEIEPWVKSKAIMIQKSVLDNVMNLLSDASLTIDFTSMISIQSISTTDILSDLLREQFKRITIKLPHFHN